MPSSLPIRIPAGPKFAIAASSAPETTVSTAVIAACGDDRSSTSKVRPSVLTLCSVSANAGRRSAFNTSPVRNPPTDGFPVSSGAPPAWLPNSASARRSGTAVIAPDARSARIRSIASRTFAPGTVFSDSASHGITTSEPPAPVVVRTPTVKLREPFVTLTLSAPPSTFPPMIFFSWLNHAVRAAVVLNTVRSHSTIASSPRVGSSASGSAGRLVTSVSPSNPSRPATSCGSTDVSASTCARTSVASSSSTSAPS